MVFLAQAMARQHIHLHIKSVNTTEGCDYFYLNLPHYL
jgi:hypothetical protein